MAFPYFPGGNVPSAENATQFEAQKLEYLMSREANVVDNYAVPTLLSVEYPGLVKNVDKAIVRLGGMHAIDACWYKPRETIHLNSIQRPKPDARLYLHFRPNDQSSHPLVSDDQILEESTKLLLILGKRYRKRLPDGTFKYKTVYKFVGFSPFTYTFSQMCDFQILPVIDNARPFQYDQGLKMRTLRMPGFFLAPTGQPLFVLPSQFSRFHRPDYRYNYHETNASTNRSSKSAADDGSGSSEPTTPVTSTKPTFGRNTLSRNISSPKPGSPTSGSGIGKGRKFRGNERTYQLSFGSKMKVSEIEPPTEKELSNFKRLTKNQEIFDQIQEIFKKRPMWLFKAIESQLVQCSYANIKACLPLVAYNIMDGAWQRTWCLYGYDPTLPENAVQSSKLQIIDFRIVNQIKKIKPEYMPYLPGLYVKEKAQQILNDAKKAITLNNVQKNLTQQQRMAFEETLLSYYTYRPEILPPTQQVYYQMCDVHMEATKTKLGRAQISQQCSPEKVGWYSEAKLTWLARGTREEQTRVYNLPEDIRRTIKDDIERTLRSCIEKVTFEQDL